MRFVQKMTKVGKFDFIKLDVEGEEKQILQDPSSHEVLCEASCVFMELHDRFEPGCTEAFNAFLQVCSCEKLPQRQSNASMYPRVACHVQAVHEPERAHACRGDVLGLMGIFSKSSPLVSTYLSARNEQGKSWHAEWQHGE
jgi:hypothetical protein